ncbi:nucleoside hydrolase [Nostoc sp. 'Peltigera membranacea cyanobiont' 210A]|uniref:nucleoside hydrolase n=1 Tax=Nostoc sp. 'Peltigera membranacea cyanobiont' 210A TaxID=2014529 RepID=UPI000B952AAE|nr:nucleoside hydrolase [Nostoc sp. 'Peltigera membranacea cyanobiont' 210A]OYD89463.1 nucleoside hydrolase [Nostoc sp. 'Peltigera membranacea cyanobiont' 210A]
MKKYFSKSHLCYSLLSSLPLLLALPIAFGSQPAFGSTLNRTPIILDDDGSQDGMTAWAYILQNPKFEVKAMTISQGLARPQIFGNNVMRMLTGLGITGIPVAVGRETPLSGNNAFPDAFRADTDTFWTPFSKLPDKALETVDQRSAAQLLVDTINQSPDPVEILMTGSATNIAEALTIDPSIVKKISRLQIMGGAVFVPGNLREHLDPILKQNLLSEFNIWTDPVAAQKVFSAGLPIYLTPLDATNQIGFTRADQAAWKATGTPESILASQLLDYALTNISGNDPLIPNPAWDLVAAINLSEPSFCQPTPLHIEVNTDGKPEVNQGQTLAIPNQLPNTNVCLNPSLANLPFTSQELFSDNAKPHSVPEANSGLGLLAAVASSILLRKRSNRQTA